MKAFEPYLNADGKSYDGIRLMSDLSGLSRAEIAWTASRLKHLMHVEHKTREEALAVVRAEQPRKPWLTPAT